MEHEGGLAGRDTDDGPGAYLSRADAVPLRRELVSALGSAQLALCGLLGEAR